MYIALLLNLLTTFSVQNPDSMRAAMVQKQIIERGISDQPTIDAMSNVPRHQFVPFDLQQYAYDDRPLPIGHKQTISQPYIVAYMTEQLKLKKSDKVLEIGTGSGYQAAVLAEIVEQVYTIEIIEELSKTADATLKDLEYNNISCKYGDGYHGWPEHAPFNAIIITAAPNDLPQTLFDQLCIGGKLIAPIEHKGFQHLIIYTKTAKKITSKRLIGVRFVPFTRKPD